MSKIVKIELFMAIKIRHNIMSLTNTNEATTSKIMIYLARDYYTSYDTKKQNHQDRNNLHVNGRTPTHHFSVPEFLVAKNQTFLLQHTSAFPLSLQ